MPKGPRRLYKYRAFNVNTLRLLNQAEVFYADPTEFNDPLDSNPTIHVDTDIPSLEKLLYKMLLETEGKEHAQKQIGNHRYMSTEYGDYKSDPETATYYTGRLATHVHELLANDLGRHGVMSLARKWNCPLMWSHYADEHRGLCIEYDMTDTVFKDLRPVAYDAPRAVRVSDLIDWKLKKSAAARERILSTFFFSKAPQWRYEREWRDLATEIGPQSAPARISAIHFGLRCDHSVIDAIVRLYARSEDRVKFFVMRPLDGSFQLKRCPVDTDEVEATSVRTPAFIEFRDMFVDESGDDT
ncbi:hypothetical protein RHDC4_01707 [Rhodocyclaceae bacterium]|nr:hypothetical protein RHDC4_01707 [Rhodocyclaceae bacterium]